MNGEGEERATSLREHLSAEWDKLSEDGAEAPDRTLTPITDDSELKTLNSSSSSEEAPAQETQQTEEQEQQEIKQPKETKTPPAKRTPARNAAKADATAGQTQQTPTGQTFKAPGSWRPELREHWSKVPLELQAEITRRETEVNRAMGQATAARQFAEEFQNTVRPYEALIRSSGITPIQAMNNLMSTATSLQMGTPAQKAQIAAKIIQNYGVDIAMLDQVLSGQQPKGGGGPDPSLIQALDQRLKPITEFMGSFQQQQQQENQRIAQTAQQATEQFAADPKNEFYEDLREDMADLLEFAAKRGRPMTLKQAYEQAAMAHPEISKVISSRKSAEEVKNRAANLQRARRAASSLSSGTPADLGGGNSGKPQGRRAAVAQAFDDLSQGT